MRHQFVELQIAREPRGGVSTRCNFDPRPSSTRYDTSTRDCQITCTRTRGADPFDCYSGRPAPLCREFDRFDVQFDFSTSDLDSPASQPLWGWPKLGPSALDSDFFTRQLARPSR